MQKEELLKKLDYRPEAFDTFKINTIQDELKVEILTELYKKCNLCQLEELVKNVDSKKINLDCIPKY